MTILVGYLPRPEGDAALRFAASLARDRGEDLLVMGAGPAHESAVADGLTPAQQQAVVAIIEEAGVPYRLQPMTGLASPANQILEAEFGSDEVTVVVLGIKHRTAVGRFILGSNAERIMQRSRVPVVTVKSDGALSA